MNTFSKRFLSQFVLLSMTLPLTAGVALPLNAMANDFDTHKTSPVLDSPPLSFFSPIKSLLQQNALSTLTLATSPNTISIQSSNFQDSSMFPDDTSLTNPSRNTPRQIAVRSEGELAKPSHTQSNQNISHKNTSGKNTHESNHNDVVWHPWSEALFEEAKRTNKLVILDLEAVWCHWCHVMHEKTYSNPDVQAALKKDYIAIRVDQDSRPDLSNRYMDYGWPATIIFSPDGKELVKRAGFIPPQTMAGLLKKVVSDPTPEKTGELDTASLEKFSESPFLAPDVRAGLEARYFNAFDEEQGSWGSGGHKFLDPDSMELTFLKIKQGEPKAREMAIKTLDGQINLLDPVWGGMYQYSTGGVWTNKHFEKIMSVQTENIRIYAQAYGMFGDAKYLDVAKQNLSFLQTFLKSPTGGYYTSMDADVVPGQHSEEYFLLGDAERRKQGIPRVDKHQYARENGWVISALTTLYEVTGEEAYLQEAEATVQWVMDHRSISGTNGGYRHDEKDLAGPYLGDNLAMGRAFLNLYKVTGDRDWLKRSEETARFISQTFRNTTDKPGFLSAAIPSGSYSKVNTARPLRDENVAMTRYANGLFHVTGNPEYKTLSELGMRFLATPEIANIPFSASTLLPDTELQQAPLHLTIVGQKDDPVAQELFQTALKYPGYYKRVDWWDKREGPMPNPDVNYPTLPKAAAFVCTEKRCSLPVFKPDALAPLINRLTQAKTPVSPKPCESCDETK
jgi:uncharacterized protein